MIEILNLPRIHLVAGFDPVVQKSGDTDRLISWLDYFQSREQPVHLYCLKDGESTVSSYENSFLSKYDIQVDWHYSDSIVVPRFKHLRRHVLAIVKGRPPWIQHAFSSSLKIALFRNAKEADLILFYAEAAGSYLPTQPKLCLVWDKLNVVTYSTKGEWLESKGALLKTKFLYHLWLATRFEEKLLSKPSVVIATSELEIDHLLSIDANLNCEVLKSVKGTYSPLRVQEGSTTLAWLGSASYGPNWRGIIRFLKETNGFLLDTGYKIRIIGSRFTKSQENYLRSFGSVEFVGFVENLDLALQGCKALIVPLWSGAGVKLKSLDALRLGIPLVSTPVGMEGIPIVAALGVSTIPMELAKICVDANLSAILENRTLAKQVFLAEFTQKVFNENAQRIFEFNDALS